MIIKTEENLRLVYEAIKFNETSYDADVIYGFSHASGGNSGYSFGAIQFDVRTNTHARMLLSKMGFSSEEIKKLIQETVTREELVGFSSRLKTSKNKKFLDEACMDYLSRKIDEVLGFDIVRDGEKITMSRMLYSDVQLIHLVDMEIQFNLDDEGLIHKWSVLQYDNQVTDIQEWCANFKAVKLNTRWGKKRPDDVERRYNNIMDLCEREGLLEKDSRVVVDEMPEWLQV